MAVAAGWIDGVVGRKTGQIGKVMGAVVCRWQGLQGTVMSPDLLLRIAIFARWSRCNPGAVLLGMVIQTFC